MTLTADYLCDCASALNSPYTLLKNQPAVTAFHCTVTPLTSVGWSVMSKRGEGNQPHVLEMGHQISLVKVSPWSWLGLNVPSG